jgi:hypothetical protein
VTRKTLLERLAGSLSVFHSSLDPVARTCPKIASQTLSTRYRGLVSGRGGGGRAVSSTSTVAVCTVIVTVSETPRPRISPP